MLIIFDCDGVLVDSERMASEVFSDVLASINIHMPPADCFMQFKGKTLPACYSYLENTYHFSLPKDFEEKLNVETKRRFDQDLQAVNGVKEILDLLSEKNIPFCVASNGAHRKIKNSLTKTNLIHYFPHRFSVEDVSKGKPNPDLFLYAADKMGVDVQECIVIEDSISGVNAALSANMGVAVYQSDEQLIKKGVWHFANMRKLIDALQKNELRQKANSWR